jgi:hypothetical protein
MIGVPQQLYRGLWQRRNDQRSRPQSASGHRVDGSAAADGACHGDTVGLSPGGCLESVIVSRPVDPRHQTIREAAPSPTHGATGRPRAARQDQPRRAVDDHAHRFPPRNPWAAHPYQRTAYGRLIPGGGRPRGHPSPQPPRVPPKSPPHPLPCPLPADPSVIAAADHRTVRNTTPAQTDSRVAAHRHAHRNIRAARLKSGRSAVRSCP